MPHDLRLGPWSHSIGTEQQITSSIHIDVSRNGPVGSVAYLNELPAPLRRPMMPTGGVTLDRRARKWRLARRLTTRK
jgi:hypothetical protein